MKVLLHTCCGPCTIYPLEVLRGMNIDVMGYFYRHNIHPFSECLKREETLKAYAADMDLKMIWQQGYELEEFLRSVTFREKNRCKYCYHARLKAAALVAKKGKFDGFSTTLLYSKFQNHQAIIDTGQALGKQYGLKFIYQDFREGWKQGIETSKSLGMYRQQYCGCIYSEKERFYNANKEKPST